MARPFAERFSCDGYLGHPSMFLSDSASHAARRESWCKSFNIGNAMIFPLVDSDSSDLNPPSALSRFLDAAAPGESNGRFHRLPNAAASH